MAVHIDGYIANAAHTMILKPLGTNNTPVEGPVADCVCAAHFASQLVLANLRPGVDSNQILSLVQQAADAFNVRLMEGPVLQETKRFLMDAPPKCLSYSLDPVEQKRIAASPFVVEPFEAYTVTVMMTTAGTGKQMVVPGDISVFQRNVLTEYQLRSPAARALFAQVCDTCGVFPFHWRRFSEETSNQFGVKECLEHNLLTALPAYSSKSGSAVCHFKFTAVVQDTQTVRITNAGLPLPYVHSEYSLPAPLAAALESTQSRTVAFKPHP